jgi:hypothetical protein
MVEQSLSLEFENYSFFITKVLYYRDRLLCSIIVSTLQPTEAVEELISSFAIVCKEEWVILLDIV